MPSILIVEDESVMAMLLTIRFKKAGFVVCGAASSGDEAIEYANTKSPDFILMDIRLCGDIDGIEAARRILKNQDAKIIFMTGYSNEEVIQRAQELKPLDYLIKPFDISELVERVKSVSENPK